MAVAEARGFRRAAARLGVEPSAVSRRVRAVEDRIGASLFERGRIGVRPTSAGEQFFADVRQLLVRFDLAVERVQTAGRADNGCVRIGVFGTLASS